MLETEDASVSDPEDILITMFTHLGCYKWKTGYQMSGEVDSTWDHRGDFFDRKHPQTHRSLLLEIRHLKKNNVENKCNLIGGGGSTGRCYCKKIKLFLLN